VFTLISGAGGDAATCRLGAPGGSAVGAAKGAGFSIKARNSRPTAVICPPVGPQNESLAENIEIRRAGRYWR
jgi:hypothetical protein